MEEIMWSETPLHPIFGVFIALGGLALAVLVSGVLYTDEKQKSAAIESYQEIQEERKAA
jgi:hypothetical protein